MRISERGSGGADREAIASGVLGFVQGPVGAAHQVRQVLAWRKGRHPDADGGAQQLAFQGKWQCSRSPCAAFGHPAPRRLIRSPAAGYRILSPPIRPTRSCDRNARFQRSTNPLRTSSPAVWPLRSLICLKWSRSRTSSDTSMPWRRARSISAPASSMKRRLFMAPVRLSVQASRARSRSWRLSLVMSKRNPTVPPSLVRRS